jgi:hypothetical protein
MLVFVVLEPLDLIRGEERQDLVERDIKDKNIKKRICR